MGREEKWFYGSWLATQLLLIALNELNWAHLSWWVILIPSFATVVPLLLLLGLLGGWALLYQVVIHIDDGSL
jgi:hypothetical protein